MKIGLKEKMKNITPYLKTNSWFNFNTFYEMIAKQPGMLRFIEIGVWKGHSIAFLANCLLKNQIPFELFAVDIWDKNFSYPDSVTNFEKEHIKEIFEENLKIQGVYDFITPMHMSSIEASNKFKEGYFDFILIDASHKEIDVINDIKAWWPKLRIGGIMACHDYVPWCGVMPAIIKVIEEGFIEGKKEIMNDMFYITKEK